MNGRCVVVTGAAGALGSQVARHLVSKGFPVALVDTTMAKERLSTLEKELGKNTCAVRMDSTKPEQWASAISTIEQSLGSRPAYAALIAGGYHGGAKIYEDADENAFSNMMETNLETVHQAFRALLPSMVTAKHGSIVVVGSRVVERPWTGATSGAYTASKAAVVALAQAASAEVLAFDVRINAILPSVIDTPANRSAMPSSNFAKWVSPDSIARVIAFLLSDDAKDISGAAIPVYGQSA